MVCRSVFARWCVHRIHVVWSLVPWVPIAGSALVRLVIREGIKQDAGPAIVLTNRVASKRWW
jgi:hypothetical protein